MIKRPKPEPPGSEFGMDLNWEFWLCNHDNPTVRLHGDRHVAAEWDRPYALASLQRGKVMGTGAAFHLGTDRKRVYPHIYYRWPKKPWPPMRLDKTMDRITRRAVNEEW